MMLLRCHCNGAVGLVLTIVDVKVIQTQTLSLLLLIKPLMMIGLGQIKLKCVKLWYSSLNSGSGPTSCGACTNCFSFTIVVTRWWLTHPPWTKWPPFHRQHFQMHFHNEKFCIPIQISLKFVPKGPIDNNPALV